MEQIQKRLLPDTDRELADFYRAVPSGGDAVAESGMEQHFRIVQKQKPSALYNHGAVLRFRSAEPTPWNDRLDAWRADGGGLRPVQRGNLEQHTDFYDYLDRLAYSGCAVRSYLLKRFARASAFPCRC